MPITAERMLNLINLASQTMETSEAARKKLKEICTDGNDLQRRLNELGVNDELVDDLVFSIINSSRDGQMLCVIPAELAANLGEERKHFVENQTKHQNQAARMRLLRKGIRKRRGVDGETETLPRERGITGEEITKRLAKARQMVRQDEADVAAAKQAIAEGEAEGGLTSLEELKKEFGFVEETEETEETPHTSTPTVNPNSDPTLAARSEQIPLENDEESWLPKQKG